MKRFRANQPAVIHQAIEGEVVVIHLETGTYYSLTAGAAWLWERLIAGVSTAELTAALTSHFEIEAADAATAVDGFLARLLAEKLVVELPAGTTAVPGAVFAEASGPRAPFPPPALEKFTDMQQLLLLDPIHEVDERGWPHQPAAKP